MNKWKLLILMLCCAMMGVCGKYLFDYFQESHSNKQAYLYINKESQRVSKDALKTLDGKDVLLIFPQESRYNKTVRLLKTPKTESSV